MTELALAFLAIAAAAAWWHERRERKQAEAEVRLYEVINYQRGVRYKELQDRLEWGGSE